jgi:L-Ala-D/L-Glu epimerase
MNYEISRISLPLKKKFVVAKGEADVKTNILAICDNQYFGEASGSVQYGPSVESMEADLKQGIGYLKKKSREEITLTTLNEIEEYDIGPAARAALTGMILNYLSAKSLRYPWELLGLEMPEDARTSFTISIDEPLAMLAAIKDSPYPLIKVKLGFYEDKQVVDGFAHVVGKHIRVDVNGGWTPEKAEEMIYYLAKNGVTIIEQPTDPEHTAEWKHIKGHHNVELFIDEGLNTIEDYERYASNVDGINIKMEKCGGIIAGMRMARKARKEKRKIMLGCMVGSSIGMAQSVYMSTLADYLDLDGPLLLEEDIAAGITYEKEQIHVDREIIGGPKLKRDVVEKYLFCE